LGAGIIFRFIFRFHLILPVCRQNRLRFPRQFPVLGASGLPASRSGRFAAVSSIHALSAHRQVKHVPGERLFLLRAPPRLFGGVDKLAPP
jgi:hypothetical protein